MTMHADAEEIEINKSLKPPNQIEPQESTNYVGMHMQGMNMNNDNDNE